MPTTSNFVHLLIIFENHICEDQKDSSTCHANYTLSDIFSCLRKSIASVLSPTVRENDLLNFIGDKDIFYHGNSSKEITERFGEGG